MYKDTGILFADLAQKKIEFLKKKTVGFLMSTMMAGAYVGIGIILVMSVGNSAGGENSQIIMGSLFGIALTLVVFAGAELFSGHTMFMTFGYLHKRIKASDVMIDWIFCWSGNLFGAMLLSILFVLGGGGGWVDDPASYIHIIADLKVSSSVVELLARGAICNWLICLAIWMTARTSSDTAKCILIFWCLFAFIASGFEHGVANMTVFTLSMMGPQAETVHFYSALYNLFVVSIGNIIGGAGFIGIGYFLTGTENRN